MKLLRLLTLVCMLLSSATSLEAKEPSATAQELVSFGSTWAFARGVAQETTPRLPEDGASDSPWRTGEAPLAAWYTTPREPTKQGTRVDFSDLPRLEEGAERASTDVLWLARDFEASDVAAVESLLIEARFDGGFVVFLNGRELLRHRLDLDGNYQPFAAKEDGQDYVREGRSAFSQRAFRGVDPTALRKGRNTLAVRVHRRPGNRARALFIDVRLQAFTSPGFVKTPYLQQGGPNSMTVMFETSTISTPYVEFGSGTQLSRVATSPSTGGTLHEVTLTGLEPETRYFYRVRAEKIWPPLEGDEDPSLESPIYYFMTAPATDVGYTFLAYGDNRSRPAVHSALVERMLAERSVFAINTGDLTEDGIDERQWQREFFDPALPLMHYLPVWPSLGNHDGNHISYYEFFSLPGNESWYSFRHGNTEFFALNTAYDISPDSEQYAWFEKAVAESSARWKVVFFHHPPFACTPSRLPGFGPARQYLVPLFEAHDVDLVLTGHDHLYGHGVLNGVHYVITGGGGAWTYRAQVEAPLSFCEQVHHYLVVRVEHDSLFVRAISLDGVEIDTFAIQR